MGQLVELIGCGVFSVSRPMQGSKRAATFVGSVDKNKIDIVSYSCYHIDNEREIEGTLFEDIRKIDIKTDSKSSVFLPLDGEKY